jgi:hypothetical protein
MRRLDRELKYSGTLGRTDNCQVAVSLHLAGERGSGCIGMQLYLPKEWAKSRKRRAAAGVPKQVRFARKWELALAQVEEALEWGVRPHVVLADAGYGAAREFRAAGGVAEGGEGADEVLSLLAASQHAAQEVGAAGQTALARGARLPGAEAGSRAGPF